jgi:hypothetical protein
MKRFACRRLAVVGDRGELRGLLCLKAHGRGFCADADVGRRPRAHRLARSPDVEPKRRRFDPRS